MSLDGEAIAVGVNKGTMGMSVGLFSISGLFFLFIFLSGVISEAIPQEPEQTISDFSLSGFGEDGKRTWEISGKSADIFPDLIKLNDFLGEIYDQEMITVVADRGDFDKTQDKVHLENNVVITTESGVELTTDYLDWDRTTSQILSEAPVDIKKDNVVLSGAGMKGNTNLKQVDLERDVRLEIDNKKNKIVITCTGPLKINYAENVAVFNEDVFVDDGQSKMYADLMEVFFETSASDSSVSSFTGGMGKVAQVVARGNVKIAREGNISFSNEAVYKASDRTITLIGRPKLIIYPTEDMDAFTGD